MNEREAFDFSNVMLRYLRMELTPEEEQAFLQAVASDPDKQDLLNYYKHTSTLEKDLGYADRLNTEAAWDKVMAQVTWQASQQGNVNQQRHPIWRFRGKWLQYAAIVVAAVAATIWWYGNHRDSGIIADSQYGFKNDVLPGGNQALLVLSDGKTVPLDQSVRLIREGKYPVSASRDGELSYHQGVDGDPSRVNEVRVPQAGQYKVILSDGTTVWVNSLSTLTFPVQFGAGERRVTLEGEAFFDVTKDPARPFYVEVGGKTIQVLGTRFNVSAYSDEVMTTLVEGAVRIADTRSVRMLKPGQQAIAKPSGIDVLPANLEKATAWKDGYFVFEGDDIQTIMEQVARWYEVQVHYTGEIPQDVYSGSVPRHSTVGGVLQMLMDVSDLRFEVDGRDITVINKHEK
ncbi:FecR family protein [Parapedobacter sp. DT-150]|uniref:FecR family protein n=1 Tax=Parapedobacter sp. DT-150 TaxID=3396162 RepID=UPI003F1DAE9D